jgi:AraC-like DNA-binding protein
MEQSISSSSCHLNPAISSEQFIPDHIFIHLISGSMVIYDGDRTYELQSGDYGLAKRNHLAKYTKQPLNGDFKAVSVFLSQPFLINFCNEYSVKADSPASNEGFIQLKSNSLLDHCTQSLIPYLGLNEEQYKNVLLLKYKELVLLLLQTNPAIKNVLFDFSDPGKIDLEAFMNRNFRFNVSLGRFAYLTGRSLTTFKRDFERIFHESPGRWLLEKRLQEACFLIEKKDRKPSEVYLEVGFEDLSHFSYAFKYKYGLSPNQFKKKAGN